MSTTTITASDTTSPTSTPSAVLSLPSTTSPIIAPYTFIDTLSALQTLLTDLKHAYIAYITTRKNFHAPFLYVDLEGTNLCRHGTISLCQLHVPSLQMTYIIDILNLGSEAFTTTHQDEEENDQNLDIPLPTPLSLKSLLESPTLTKCFFDVRNDSDALYNLYGISMSNVTDVQILENATRRGNKRLLNGLKRAIERDSGLPRDVLVAWMEVKEKGKSFFQSPTTSSTEVPSIKSKKPDDSCYAAFDARPLPRELLEYCINDVIHLPRLWALYDAKLNIKWRAKTENEAIWRLQLAKQEVYYGNNGNMALSPF